MALIVSDGRLICVCAQRRGSGFLWSWPERVRPSAGGRHRDGARALASIAGIVLQRGVDVPLSPVQILKQRDQFRDRAWYIVVDHEQVKLVADAFHKGITHGLIIIRCMGGQALVKYEWKSWLFWRRSRIYCWPVLMSGPPNSRSKSCNRSSRLSKRIVVLSTI